MWKICSTMLLMCVMAQAGQNNIYTEYSITPSSQVVYYHYPAPPQSQQLHTQPQHLGTARTIASSQQRPTYQNQYQYQYNNKIVSQQQQQQQQHQQRQLHYQTSQPNSQLQTYYRSSSASGIHQLPVVTRQFNSPALDNAAFTMALTNQGYTVGNAPAASSNAARSLTTSQSQSQTQQTSLSAATPELSSSLSSSHSLNVKLPLPFGVTPLNIATLPLQGGTPYSAIANGVNSYGTTYPQRKKRQVGVY